MSIKFKRTGDADYPRTIKALVMGQPKSGKTSFVATAPNVLIASCESGLMSIAHKDVGYVDIENWHDIESLFLVLNDDTLRKKAAAQLGMEKIETVAIDTLDALQELCKRQIMTEIGKDQLRMQDWGTLKERMAAMLKGFVSLPTNVIFTVHMGTSTDFDDRTVYVPLLQGSIQNEIAGYVDFSLMSGRRKVTGLDGVTRVEYFLRNEGDEEHPHLGNRGADRIPHECAPDFAKLHELTFAAIGNLPRTQESELEIKPEKKAKKVEVVEPEPASEENVAEKDSSSSATGQPVDNADELITPAGISAVTKSYKAAELKVPADLESWTLAKARDVAKAFAKHKRSVAAGNADTRDLVITLTNAGAFDGEESVGTPIKKTKPAADAMESLGAVLVGVQVLEGAACADCGNTVDDLEVAQLGQTRYKRPLCISCFKQVQKAEKE